MKLIKFLGGLLCVLCMASCGTLERSNSYEIKNTRLRLDMTMDDLNYLGESEISIEYDTYLGFITKIQKVNGEPYDPFHTRRLSIPTQSSSLKGKGLDLAASKLLDDYPEATYFQVIFKSTEKERLFLGSVKKTTAKVRAYSLK